MTASFPECRHGIAPDTCIYCGPLKTVALTVRVCAHCALDGIGGTWHRDDTLACVVCGTVGGTPFDPLITRPVGAEEEVYG